MVPLEHRFALSKAVRSPRARLALVCLALVLAAALAGCGSSGGGATGPTYSGPVQRTPATDLFFRTSQGGSPTLPNATLDAGRYEFVILAGAYWQLAARLHAANPHIRVLLYKAVTETNMEPTALADRARTTVIDYAEAARDHPDWLLRDAQGKLVTRPYGGGTDVLVDVGSRGVQQQSYEGILRQARADGWDGVFLDDVLPTLQNWLPGRQPGVVSKYPSDASWSAATRSFLSYVGPRLKAKGLLVVANTCCNLEYHQRTDWASLIDGTMDEGFLSPATSKTDPLVETSSAPWKDWRGYLKELTAAEASGKIFLAHTPGEVAQTGRRRYALATFMLGWNGRGSRFEYQTSDSSASWGGADFEDAMQLGKPLGSYERLSSGIYRRSFQGGVVLVDPRPKGSRPLAIDLDGTYSGFSLSSVGRVTLSPGTGYILLRA